MSSKFQQIMLHEALHILRPEDHHEFLILAGSPPAHVDDVGASNLLCNMVRYLDRAYGSECCGPDEQRHL